MLLGVQPVSRTYRHVYGETLGTWRAADLLIGLAYLARRDPPGGSVLQDIATAGTPYGAGLCGAERVQARVRAAARPGPTVRSRASVRACTCSLLFFLPCAPHLPKSLGTHRCFSVMQHLGVS